MPRPASGTITETQTGFRLRFRANGERESITLRKADGYTRRRAQERLDDAVEHVRRGIWLPEQSDDPAEPAPIPTFAEFAEQWYESRKPDLSERTQEDYKSWRLERHLVPYFRDVPIDCISVRDVDRFRDEKKQSLTGSSVKKLLQLLSQILDTAEEYELISRNPLSVNRRGRYRGLTSQPSRPVLETGDEITALLDAAGQLDDEAGPSGNQGVRRMAIALMTFGGVRIGEAVAIRWRDVNLEDRILMVPGTKTEAALRRVPMLPALADEVARWRDVSLHTNPEGPLLATRSGAAWDTHNLRSRIVNEAVLRANQNRLAEGSPPLQRVTPHGLRRTAASLWAAIGWNPSQMMRAMGHTQANLTLSVYAVAADYGENQREGLRAVARVKEGVGM